MNVLAAIAVAGALAVASASAASAATLSASIVTDWTGILPGDTTSKAGGTLTGAVLRYGSMESHYRSPFDGSGGLTPAADGYVNDPDEAAAAENPLGYWAVGPGNGGGVATLDFDGVPQKEFSFVWGSVDSWNTIEFYKGDQLTYILTAALAGLSTSGLGAYFATVSDFIFDKIVFSSGTEALEMAMFKSVAAVPVPPAIALLLGGIGGLGLFGWSRKRKAQIAA